MIENEIPTKALDLSLGPSHTCRNGAFDESWRNTRKDRLGAMESCRQCGMFAATNGNDESPTTNTTTYTTHFYYYYYY
jgi:hypothetical protein